MPLETATYVAELNSSNPLQTEGVNTADDHLRKIKATLLATFPNLDGEVSASPDKLNNGALPTGAIVLWYGAANAIPTGWDLCDGSTYDKEDGSGTIVSPNLTDKFVIGAGGNYAVGANGGSATAGAITSSSNGAHTHSGATGAGGDHSHGGTTGSTTLTTSQIPSHTHTANHKYQGINSSTGSLDVLVTVAEATSDGTDSGFNTGSAGTGGSHNHTITTSGTHTHTISSDGAHTHTVTPPYYALCYIIRL